MPERHHQDDRLQTLLYKTQLDATLTKLRRDARLAIEELGTNLLHLAVGFLQWRDRDAKDYFAPLILIPVEITSQTVAGAVVLRLAWTGEDLQPNLSLEKRLRDDFGVVLPVRDDEEAPEAYFRRVRAVLPPGREWAVRTFATLSLFQFGNLVLYRDLDPALWAPGEAPAEQGLVRSVAFGAGAGASGAAFDEPSPTHIDLALPLIDRADSSQARALVRALSSRSLVIQGPPGTGKSQTITNLIAAALARGETVLFVAEKLAALEVVQGRLVDAGLGDFVLELHSHKTRKQALLEEIKRRIERSYPPVERFAAEEARLAERRATLDAHVEAVAQTVGALGWPVSRVLFEAGAARLRRRAAGLDAVRLDPSPFLALTESEFERTLGKLRELEELARGLARFGPPRKHPWAGLSSDRVLGAVDEDDVVRLATAWRTASVGLADAIERASAAIGIVEPATVALATAFAEVAAAEATVRTIRADHHAAVAASGVIFRALGLSRGGEAADIATAAAVAEHVAALPDNPDRHALANLDSDGAAKTLREAREALTRIASAGAALKGELDVARAQAYGAAALRETARTIATSGFLRFLSPRYRAAKAEAAALLRGGFDRRTAPALLVRAADHLDAAAEWTDRHRALAGPDLAEAARRLDTAIALEGWIAAAHRRFGAFGPAAGVARTLLSLRFAELAELRTFSRDAAPLQRTAEALKAAAPGGMALERVLAAHVSPSLIAPIAHADDTALSEVFAHAARVADARRDEADAAAAFVARTGLSGEVPLASPTLSERDAALSRAIDNRAALAGWVAYDRFLRSRLPDACRGVVDLVAAGTVRPDDGTIVFEDTLFDALARAAHDAFPALVRSANLDAARAAYREADARVMELRAAHIAAELGRRRAPDGTTGRVVAELTELHLLRRELRKKSKHIPIRQLVRRAGAALQALKPCFMMGPLSVAQYLAPSSITFDLVIFDEASQLKPEQALGALARARRAVVVGDTNQLPPTDFFGRIGADGDGEGDDGDGIGVGTDTSSILESAALTSPTEMLRWHYRSRDPRLIQFSNERFYDGRLVLFPTAHAASEDLGIRFRHLPDATYRNSRNEVEARAVAAAAVDHLRHRPQESLGVVAMNVAQRDLIDAEIDAALAADPALREAREAGQTEPFFVKNLENVQGDERDVIMISMTYGPEPGSGRVMQRFGPINAELGWRRLNVLFSRAKKRMEIFSSMQAEHITGDVVARRGPRELRAFLHFAETGKMDAATDAAASGRPPDSEFEESVIAGLRRAGFACRPQIGVKGFFVDIGIVDPDAPGGYAVGVECDGATYHSSRSARDRDRLRQDILEAMGWTIERVWSTDWFRDPERELDGLVRRINARIGERRAARRRAAQRSVLFLEHKPQPAADDPSTRPNASGTSVPDGSVAAAQLEAPAPAAMPGLLPHLPETPTTVAAETRPASPADDGPIGLETARDLLIKLRSRIEAAHPDIPAHANILRQQMLAELLRRRPIDKKEFNRMIPQTMRSNTLAGQLSTYGEEIFAILERVRI